MSTSLEQRITKSLKAGFVSGEVCATVAFHAYHGSVDAAMTTGTSVKDFGTGFQAGAASKWAELSAQREARLAAKQLAYSSLPTLGTTSDVTQLDAIRA